MELVSADSVGLSQDAESAEAARMAREEMRNRLATQRPYNTSGEGDGGKSKTQSDPPGEKERGDKGKDGKGKGKHKQRDKQ